MSDIATMYDELEQNHRATTAKLLLSQRQRLGFRKRARAAESDLSALRAAARALVASLPRCTAGIDCKSIATKAVARGGARYCDEHAELESFDIPDYPRAAPLRALLRLLGEEATP